MEEVRYELIDQQINELVEFVMDPNNTLINNITIVEDVELSTIILTNYKLLNINIEEALASEDSLETLINDLEKIILNYTMKQLGIDIKKLVDAKAIKELELK